MGKVAPSVAVKDICNHPRIVFLLECLTRGRAISVCLRALTRYRFTPLQNSIPGLSTDTWVVLVLERWLQLVGLELDLGPARDSDSRWFVDHTNHRLLKQLCQREKKKKKLMHSRVPPLCRRPSIIRKYRGHAWPLG